MKASAYILFKQLFTGIAASGIDFRVDQSFCIPSCDLLYSLLIFRKVPAINNRTVIPDRPSVTYTVQRKDTLDALGPVKIRNLIRDPVSVRITVLKCQQRINILHHGTRNRNF